MSAKSQHPIVPNYLTISFGTATLTAAEHVADDRNREIQLFSGFYGIA
jgi:hypothetical protein